MASHGVGVCSVLKRLPRPTADFFPFAPRGPAASTLRVPASAVVPVTAVAAAARKNSRRLKCTFCFVTAEREIFIAGPPKRRTLFRTIPAQTGAEIHRSWRDSHEGEYPIMGQIIAFLGGLIRRV